MSNLPDDCQWDSPHKLPWADVKTNECASCGSTVSVSNLDKNVLVCDDSENCDWKVDLSDTGLNDW